MRWRHHKGILIMCALATAVVVIVGSQASVVGQPRNQIVKTPALLEEAEMLERAFEHCLDNVDPAMSDRELMLVVSRACRPVEDSEIEYSVIICKVGVKESNGIRVVRVELEYELRDANFVLTNSLRVKREFGGD